LTSFLAEPVVVNPFVPLPPFSFFVSTSLSPQPRRIFITSRLSGPTEVAFPPNFGPGVRLAEPDSSRDTMRRQAKSRLLIPAVVIIPVPGVAERPIVSHVIPSRPRTKTTFVLKPPAAVGVGIFFRSVQVNSVPPRPRTTTTFVLKPPAAVGVGIFFRSVQVNFAVDALARSFRFVARVPMSRLSGPIVVSPEGVKFGPGVRLTDTFSRRDVVRFRAQKSKLQPPKVVFPFTTGIAFHGPGVRLTKPFDRVPVVRSRLRPPVVVNP
jgi:hypothetical protein